MKTIRVNAFGGPEVLKLEEAPKPQAGEGQAVVKVHAVGVNPVDTYIRSGSYGKMATPPYTPGADSAGVIESIGEGMAPWKAGDRVYTWGALTGTYAEYALCARAQLHPLPAKNSFEQGAALGVPYATAHRALFGRGGARSGETLLVHGASGGVGVAAVQLARAAGLTVFGTAGTDAGRKLVLKEGAHRAFDHRSPEYLHDVMRETGGRGVDIILEMLANVNLGKDLGALAKKGRVVVVGSRGKVELDPRDTMSRDADVRGMTLFNALPEEVAAIHSALLAGLENGTLRPVVGKTFPLAEAAAAHKAVLEPGAHGKIVLIP